MKLSIIIVNYRSWGHLKNALFALSEGFPDDWEVIVVDNESEPDMFDLYRTKFPWVNFVANQNNTGFGHGCIIGVHNSSGEQLLFMNPDVIAKRDDVQALLEEKAANPDVAILAPKQIDTNGKAQKVFDEFPDLLNQSKIAKAIRRRLAPARFPDPRATYTDLTYCDWVTGSVLLVSRSDYDNIGGWSKDYWMYVEDADLCRKADDAGMRVAYTPNVKVMHAHGGSSRLNVAVKSMTKLEVIISKHVYISRHLHGINGLLTHTLVGLSRMPLLLLASILDILSFRRIPALRVRSNIATGLLSYYAGVLRTGTWLSPRAKMNQEE